MKLSWRLGPLLLLSTACTAEPAGVVQSEAARFEVKVLTRKLDHPWGLAFLPDGRMLVTERIGRLRLVAADGRLDPVPVSGVPEVVAEGQGGLLDVALHPDFKRNGWVYLSYSAGSGGLTGTEVARGRLDGHSLRDVATLFRMQPKSSDDQHFGGRIVFDRAGFLYLTLGDRGEMPRAQLPGDHAGSVIRLTDEGRVPNDNPYVARLGWRPEKYTLGNRNPQGLALDPTGQLWLTEHGPQGGDELNKVDAGVNYGWPVVTHGRQYITGAKIGEGKSKPGMRDPVYYWVPSIAPSGLAFYTGKRFPGWRGDLFAGALKDRMLVRLTLKDGKVVHEERLIKNRIGRIRDVRNGPDGYLYLLTDEDDGVLARLEPAP
ncbi:PQQ-dependent sugar dehydrogenase [Crenobacter cavernae]|uniref:PQQ-dependent sugar dehydrogenase n=1 Tax=Crenobacter cavernae TaxID=2290923 RepID=A0A345Y952_9NEIS|nr:PQQ-dependent sugar dehydrogenase [Crenobacter cavernae]AXK40454.1 PQQ-dependent sugar dehydrogenase [Crenobacter cavernae]